MAQIITPVMGALTPVKYSLKLVELLYNDTLYPNITNTTYEGAIKDSGDRVRVRTLGKIALSAYTKGMQLVKQELTPTYEDLIIDKQYYFSFGVDDIDKLQNDVNAISEYASNTKNDMEDLVDIDILTYMSENVNSSNMIGTDYATGTVAIAASTGVVTGTGTTFTAAMVGGIFTATGLTGSYIVVSRASNTSITIADLGSTTTYSGGALAGGAAFNISGATAVAVTKSNVYEKIVALRTALGKSLSPKEDRFLVVNSQFEGILMQAQEFIPAVASAYENVVQKGLIGSIAGFKVYTTENIKGDNTTGYFFVAGNKTYCSMAMQIMKTSIIPSEMSEDSFISTVKGLLVWGRKVFNGNRGHGAVLRATLS
jgi:hypothetical protein